MQNLQSNNTQSFSIGIDIGGTFTDIVVSIKSSVPLITSGVGTKTILVNWRQSPWNNILFNPNGSQVEIFERNTWEQWDHVFKSISEKLKTYY